VRQYALEKLGESGEADAVRTRHRDHYTAMAAVLDAPAGSDYEQRVDRANIEIDNLRAGFGWSRENSDVELALALASSLQPLWLARGRLREGLAWFDAALADLDAQHAEVAPAVRARALADRAMLAEGAAGGDQNAVAARRSCELCHIAISQGVQPRPQTHCRFAAAIFGKDKDIGIPARQRIGNSSQTGATALPDVPGEQPHPLYGAPDSGGVLAGGRRCRVACS